MTSIPSVSAALHIKDPDVVLTLDIHTARWLQALCQNPISEIDDGFEREDPGERDKRLALFTALRTATSDVPDF